VRSGDSLSRLARTWQSTVAGIRSASNLSGDLIRVGQTIVIPVRSGITKFQYTFLEKGDEGVVVRALQVALNMRPKYRTGYFGDITERRVNRLKTRHGWEPDGIAGVGVWRALGA
jgi:LysM repeat protein